MRCKIKNMKKVLLLGDSIRMGYDDYVKEELKECEVYYDAEDNGRFITYTIWMFNQLNAKYGPFDVVHFNNGYWDMNREGPNGEPQTPVKDYIINLKRLIDLVRSTKAIPIFATSTPIYDTPIQDGDYQATNYKNEWVLEYNKAAVELMKQEGVMVNDLYALMEKEERCGKCYDSLHLTEDNYKKCAKQVSDYVRKALNNYKTIYLAGGCFWGVEKFFSMVKGVVATEVGYANGKKNNPSYEDLKAGRDSAAETVKIQYDASQTSLEKLLELFLLVVDPYSVNKQGGDEGLQYRSGVYYADENDKQIIKDYFDKHLKPDYKIEVLPLKKYFSAEEYHQGYLNKNPNGYCHINMAKLKPEDRK